MWCLSVGDLYNVKSLKWLYSMGLKDSVVYDTYRDSFVYTRIKRKWEWLSFCFHRPYFLALAQFLHKFCTYTNEFAWCQLCPTESPKAYITWNISKKANKEVNTSSAYAVYAAWLIQESPSRRRSSNIRHTKNNGYSTIPRRLRHFNKYANLKV
jgi:hypothetical protein